ncbi:MAG: hypothetical protein KC609_21885 [Myxococcales bacterium]|nr:hypothetical protein [Myxococcales bacterium]
MPPDSQTLPADPILRLVASDEWIVVVDERSVRLCAGANATPLQRHPFWPMGRSAPLVDLGAGILCGVSLEGLELLELRSGTSHHLMTRPEARSQLLSIGPGGDAVAALGEDGELRVWQTSDGQLLRQTPLGSTGSPPHEIQLLSRGRLLIAGADWDIRLLDESGDEIWHRYWARWPGSLPRHIAGDEDEVIVGTRDHGLWVFDAATGDQRGRAIFSGRLAGFAAHPDRPGAPIVALLANGALELIGTTRSDPPRQLAVGIEQMARGGDWIAASGDGEISLWSADSGELAAHWPTADRPMSIAVTPTGRVVVAQSGGAIAILERPRAAAAKEAALRFDVPPASIEPPPPPRLVRLSAPAPDGPRTLVIIAPPPTPVWSYDPPSLVLLGDGERALVLNRGAPMFDGGPALGRAFLVDLRHGERIRELEPLTGMTLGPTWLALHPDGRRVVAGVGQPNLVIWEIESGALQRAHHWTSRRSSSLGALHPDGRRVVLCDSDGALLLGDLSDDVLVQRFEGLEARAQSLAIDPAGRQLAASGIDGSLRLWSFDSPGTSRRLPLDPAGVVATAFDSDGQLHAVSGRTLYRWSDSASSPTQEELPTGADELARLPDGLRLAIGNALHWRAANGDDLLVESSVIPRRRLLHPDGKRLIVADAAGRVLVWSLDSRWKRQPGGSRTEYVMRCDGAVAEVVTRRNELVYIHTESGERTSTLPTPGGTAATQSRAVARPDAAPSPTSAADGDRLGSTSSDSAPPPATPSELPGDYVLLDDGSAAVSNERTGAIEVWRLDPLERIEGYPLSLPYWYPRQRIAAAPDGAWIVWADLNHLAFFLDRTTGELRQVAGEADGATLKGVPLDLATAGPNAGRRLLVRADAGVRLFDPLDGATLLTLDLADGEPRLDTCGRWILFSSAWELRLYSADDGRLHGVWPHDGGHPVQVLPSGRVLFHDVRGDIICLAIPKT